MDDIIVPSDFKKSCYSSSNSMSPLWLFDCNPVFSSKHMPQGEGATAERCLVLKGGELLNWLGGEVGGARSIFALKTLTSSWAGALEIG